MSYVEKALLPGEVVVYRARPHWAAMSQALTVAAIFGVLGLFMWTSSSGRMAGNDGRMQGWAGAGEGYLGVASAFVLAGFVKLSSTELTLTNRRVLAGQGFFRRRTFEVPLAWLATITVDETLLGRVLGYGTVTLRGTGNEADRFPKIRHALEFRRRVQEQWHASRSGSSEEAAKKS